MKKAPEMQSKFLISSLPPGEMQIKYLFLYQLMALPKVDRKTIHSAIALREF